MGWTDLYRRLAKKRGTVPEGLWTRTLQTSSYARALPTTERRRLREFVARFLATKSLEGAAGVTITPSMRVRIALHACLPILNLGLEYYSDWVSIVIYPGDFRVQEEYLDELGVVHRGMMDLCGQSMAQGPMVLSWEAMQEEDRAPSDRDLVIHECAHKLDVLNGNANGFPPLHADMNPREWSQDFQAAYERLCDTVETNRSDRIDPYAAENPAEFFAVTSETFFTAPHLVRDEFPAVYAQLQRFYRQDPYRLLQRE